jgi:hypothetical protein
MHLVLPRERVLPPSLASVAPFTWAPKPWLLAARTAVLGRVVALQLCRTAEGLMGAGGCGAAVLVCARFVVTENYADDGVGSVGCTRLRDAVRRDAGARWVRSGSIRVGCG